MLSVQISGSEQSDNDDKMMPRETFKEYIPTFLLVTVG
jgi:hypothetical protein